MGPARVGDPESTVGPYEEIIQRVLVPVWEAIEQKRRRAASAQRIIKLTSRGARIGQRSIK